MVKLYVEGGGDSAVLKAACREGFTTFITKAGIKNRPRIVACGGRQDAFDSFCTAIDQGEDAMLLVDSEAVVAVNHQSGTPEQWRPWDGVPGIICCSETTGISRRIAVIPIAT